MLEWFSTSCIGIFPSGAEKIARPKRIIDISKEFIDFNRCFEIIKGLGYNNIELIDNWNCFEGNFGIIPLSEGDESGLIYLAMAYDEESFDIDLVFEEIEGGECGIIGIRKNATKDLEEIPGMSVNFSECEKIIKTLEFFDIDKEIKGFSGWIDSDSLREKLIENENSLFQLVLSDEGFTKYLFKFQEMLEWLDKIDAKDRKILLKEKC
jgi:hypothetical protein